MAAAGVRVVDGVVQLHGALLRTEVDALWRALPVGPVRAIDLAGATALDTAGLALVLELAGRADPVAPVTHAPAAFADLCQAYRLAPPTA